MSGTFDCYDIMQQHQLQNRPFRAGYKTINKDPKSSADPDVLKSHQSLLRHLPLSAKQALKASTTTQFIGFVHYPPQITKLIKVQGPSRRFPASMPQELHDAITNEWNGCQLTSTDQLSTGFNVVPNFSTANIQLEMKTTMQPSPSSDSTTNNNNTAMSSSGSRKRAREVIDAEWCAKHSEQAAMKINGMDGDIDDLKQQLKETQRKAYDSNRHSQETIGRLKLEHQQLLNKLKNQDIKLQEEIQLRLEWVEAHQTMKDNYDNLIHKFGGMGRSTLTNNEWHKNNPTAAKEAFGFESWEHTKEMLQILFLDDFIGEPPTQEYINTNQALMPYEKCLVTLMRMKLWYVFFCWCVC